MLDKLNKISDVLMFEGLELMNVPKWTKNSLNVLKNLNDNTEKNLERCRNQDLTELDSTCISGKKIIADTASDCIIASVTSLTPMGLGIALNLITAAKDELTTLKDERKIRMDYILNTCKDLALSGDPNNIRSDMVLRNVPFMVGYGVVTAGAYIGETLSDIKDYISDKLVNVFDTYKEILASKLDVVKDYVFGLKPQIKNIMSKCQNPRDISNYKEKDIIDVFKSSCVLPTNKSKSCMTGMKKLDIMFSENNDTKRQMTIKNTKKFIEINENISSVSSICSQLLSLNGYHKEAKILNGFTNFHKNMYSTIANIRLNKFTFSSFTNILSAGLELLSVFSNKDDGLAKAFEQIHEHLNVINENINAMRETLDYMRKENTANFNKVFEQLSAIEVNVINEIVSCSHISTVTLLSLEQHIKTNNMYWERQFNTNERIIERLNELKVLITSNETNNFLNDMLLRNNEAFYNTDKTQYSYYRNTLVALLNQPHNNSVMYGEHPVTQLASIMNNIRITIPSKAKNAAELVNIRGKDIDGIYHINNCIFQINIHDNMECNIHSGVLPLYVIQQLQNLSTIYNKSLIIEERVFEFETKNTSIVCMHPLIFKLHLQTLLYSMLMMYNEVNPNIRINFQEIKQIVDITNTLQNNITCMSQLTFNKTVIYNELLNMKNELLNKVKNEYKKCIDDESVLYKENMLSEFRTKTLPDMYKNPPKPFNTNDINIPKVEHFNFADNFDRFGVSSTIYVPFNYPLYVQQKNEYMSYVSKKIQKIEEQNIQNYKLRKISSINAINSNTMISSIYRLNNSEFNDLEKLPIYLHSEMPEHEQTLIFELDLSKYRLYHLASLYGLGKFEGTYIIEHQIQLTISIRIKFISDIPELNNLIHKLTFEDKNIYSNKYLIHKLTHINECEMILSLWYGLDFIHSYNRNNCWYKEDEAYYIQRYTTTNLLLYTGIVTEKASKKIVSEELLNPIDQATFDNILLQNITEKNHTNIIKNKDNDFHKALNKYMKHNEIIEAFEYWTTGNYNNQHITKIEQINTDYENFMVQFETPIEIDINQPNPHLQEQMELLQEVHNTMDYLSNYVCEGPSTTELITHMAERIETTRTQILMLTNIVNTSDIDNETREQLNSILQRMNVHELNLIEN